MRRQRKPQIAFRCYIFYKSRITKRRYRRVDIVVGKDKVARTVIIERDVLRRSVKGKATGIVCRSLRREFAACLNGNLLNRRIICDRAVQRNGLTLARKTVCICRIEVVIGKSGFYAVNGNFDFRAQVQHRKLRSYYRNIVLCIIVIRQRKPHHTYRPICRVRVAERRYRRIDIIGCRDCRPFERTILNAFTTVIIVGKCRRLFNLQIVACIRHNCTAVDNDFVNGRTAVRFVIFRRHRNHQAAGTPLIDHPTTRIAKACCRHARCIFSRSVKRDVG